MKFPLVVFLAHFLVATPSYAANMANGKEIYQKTCVQCHGEKGEGNVSQEGPRLAGQHDWYILTQLQAFKNKTRSNPKMYPFIKGLGQNDFEDLAAYVSQMGK